MTDNPDLHCGRGWLARASDVLTGAEDYMSADEYARAAAMIGCGYVQLAHTTQALTSMAETSQVRSALLSLSDEPETMLGEAIEREKRAEAEARPHDDEPTPTIVHVVAEDDGNVLHVASTAGKAEQWLMSTAGNREARDALSITELVVDRG